MLFGILFWDIIFAPIPGAFETPYQSAPLDIAEDTFYYARQDMIDERLREIEHDAGRARGIVDAVDGQHREKGTWCVGVRWDAFERQDLLDIVEVSDYISASGWSANGSFLVLSVSAAKRFLSFAAYSQKITQAEPRVSRTSSSGTPLHRPANSWR